jgi:hypothetical protein
MLFHSIICLFAIPVFKFSREIYLQRIFLNPECSVIQL